MIMTHLQCTRPAPYHGTGRHCPDHEHGGTARGHLTRASVLEVRMQDFVRTARAKGLRPFAISTRHVLRNALMPVITLAGLHIGGMLGGAVVVETVFSWPGLGRLALESILARDFKVLMGILLLSSLLVVLVNILIDLIQSLLDPRIEDMR